MFNSCWKHLDDFVLITQRLQQHLLPNTWCIQLNSVLFIARVHSLHAQANHPEHSESKVWLSFSFSLLSGAYNCLANLMCSSTSYQNTVVYPSGSVCVYVCARVCVWIKSSSMVSEATTNPLKDNASVSLYIITCMSVCGCFFFFN